MISRLGTFLFRIHSMQGYEQLLQGMKLQEKEEENNEKHIGKLFREKPKTKGIYKSINSYLEAIEIVGQRKYSAGKKFQNLAVPVDMEILLTSGVFSNEMGGCVWYRYPN